MLLPILLLPLVAAVPLRSSLQDYTLDIENGTLKVVQFKSSAVTDLDLSSMSIHSIEKDALDNVQSLRSLNLANNSLESLPEFMFSNLTNLEYLNLAENKLSNLKNLFVRLENLRLLNISNNPVMHLRRGHLFGLTKSTTILTGGNIFWSISTGTFTNSFLKVDELKQLEKMKAEAELEEKYQEMKKAMDGSKEDPTLKLEHVQSTKLPIKDLTLKLCIPDGSVLSIEPLEEGTQVAEGSSCKEWPILENGKKVSLHNLGIASFVEGWYQLQFLPIASLDLSHNELAEISKDVLNELPEDLVYVNLMENRISGIWSHVIENRHLRLLNLKNNLIRNIEDGALENTNLTGLFLNGNQLESLDFVSSLPRTLTELVLSNNHITSIADGAFSGLSSLLYLNLANNKIQMLQDNVFRGLGSLQTLVVTGNSLTEIGRQAFSDMKQLNTLYLYRNHLAQLQRGVFSELINLKDLNLAWNKFQKISNDLPACIPRTLDFLHLDFNEIDTLEENSFVGSPRFALSLTGNKIPSIPRGTFDLPTLRDLHLNNNTLTTIDGDSFEGLPELKRLWLANNQIGGIPKGSCKHLDSLSILDISNNPFQRLENGALYGLTSARGNFLYIYNNQLRELQGGVFEDSSSHP